MSDAPERIWLSERDAGFANYDFPDAVAYIRADLVERTQITPWQDRHKRLPEIPDDEDSVLCWVWDGEFVDQDVFWSDGAFSQEETEGRQLYTHWMYARTPEPPATSEGKQ